MASSVDVTFGVDTKLLEKLIKNFSTLQKQLKNLNINNYKNRFFGELSSYNGRFGKKSMATFLKNFTDPNAIASTYSSKFLKMSNFVSTPEFLSLNSWEQDKLLSKKFSSKSYASAEILKNTYDIYGLKDKSSLLNKHLREVEKYSNNLTKIEEKQNKKIKELNEQQIIERKKILDQYSKPLINFGDFFDDFLEKIKTFGLYLGALSLFTFVKDIVNVRKEFESTSIMLGRVLGNFEEFSQNSSSQNIVEAKNLMKDLRNYANELGVEYGEMEKGFSKLANAVPKGTITFNDTLSSYKEMMKMFTLVGATADEQQGAIRAFYQMLEKGSLSAEEFNRQLGNTPLRAPVLQYALKGYNKMANDTLKNFDDLQNYLRSNNISTAEFFKTVFEESKLDPRNKENLYIYSLGADISRLNNAIEDFKLSLTGGFTQVNPVLNSLTSSISSITSLIQLFTKLMPLINLSIVAFAAFKVMTFSTSKSLQDMTLYLKLMQKSFNDGNLMELTTIRNEYLKKSFLSLGASVLTLSIAYSNLRDSLNDINSEGFTFTNTLQLILSSLFALGSVAEIFNALKFLTLFKRSSSIGAMTSIADLGLTGSGIILNNKGKKLSKTKVLAETLSFSTLFSGFSQSFTKLRTDFSKITSTFAKNFKKYSTTTLRRKGGFISGIKGGFSSIIPLMVSLIKNPLVIAAIITAILALSIFSFFKKRSEQKQREKREREVMSRALVLNSSSMQNNYARVDVVADFPVKSQNINSGNLDVSVRSRLNLGSNI